MRPRKGMHQVSARDFMCVCRPVAKAISYGVYEETLRRLQTTPERLLSHVVYSLNWEMQAEIVGIPNDQWSAVCAEQLVLNPDYDDEDDSEYYLKDDKGKTVKNTTYIQCDIVEHGLAATWLHFAQAKDREFLLRFTRKGWLRKANVKAQTVVADYDAATRDIWGTLEGKENMEARQAEFRAARDEILERYHITWDELRDAQEYVRFYGL